MAGGSAIRGTRVGSGPMGEQDHGNHAERIAVSYWDIEGNETIRHYAADVPADQIPETIDSPKERKTNESASPAIVPRNERMLGRIA